MSVLQSTLAQYGGLGGAALAGKKQMSLLQMLGIGGQDSGYDAPIGPMPDGSAMSGKSNQIDPAEWDAQRQSSLAELGKRLGTWGAGVSEASGATYGPPKTFGEVMAGGNKALAAQDTADLGKMKTVAEIGALGQKGMPDFDAQLQQILVKERMGMPLTPQEVAHKQAWNDINQTKTTFGADALGNVRAMPRVSLPGAGMGGTPAATPTARALPPGITPQDYEEYKRLRGQ